MPIISWSDLPKELLDSIAKRFDTRNDVLLFRAVCSSWRSSISPPKKSPPLPLMLPFPIYSCGIIRPERRGYFTLSESTIYRLESPPSEIKHCTGSSHRTGSGCLIRVKETESGKVQILNTFGSRINQFPQTSSKVLNLLNFRISEITKSYNLQYVDIDNIPVLSIDEDSEAEAFTFRKVVLSSNPVSTAHDYAVLAINNPGILCYIKLGDDKWTAMHTIYYDGELESFCAHDIVDHKGKFYLVHQKGKVVVLSYSFEVIETFASPTCDDCNRDLHFLESFGDLFLVEKHLHRSIDEHYDDEDIKRYVYDEYTKSYVQLCGIDFTSVKMKVYKLDEEERKWNEVNSLGDRVLFVCHDCCFSVSVQDFAGCKGNCIYFIDEFYCEFSNDGICTGLSDLPICVFNLEDGSCGRLHLTQAILTYSDRLQLRPGQIHVHHLAPECKCRIIPFQDLC